MQNMPNSSYNPWSPENREKAANSVYDSIKVLEDLANGLGIDPHESPEEQAESKKQAYDGNLQFLKNTLVNEYYEGYLDAKRVQDAIDAAEANPVSSIS
jgi:hypothetical protein